MRSTRDVVAIVLAVALGAALVVAVAGVLSIEIAHPEQDTTGAASTLGSIMGALGAVLIGYLLGRRTTNGG